MRYTVDFYRKLLVLVSVGDITSNEFQGIADQLMETKYNAGAIKSILPRIERALSGQCRYSDLKRVATLQRIRQAHYGLGGGTLARLNGFNAAIDNTRSKCFNFEEYTKYNTEERLSVLRTLGRETSDGHTLVSGYKYGPIAVRTPRQIYVATNYFGAPIKDLNNSSSKFINLFNKLVKYIKSKFNTNKI